jgi:regulation of enolase protein 1 (concanavalin A-like superfamily)
MWPADFNADGRTDLAGRTAGGHIQVALGNGDGTFRTPSGVGASGKPVAAGDLNHDGRTDIVAQVGTAVVVLPGTGTGSFGAARTILQAVATFAIVADMNNDGARDVVLGEEGFSLHVVPGNRDFTFGPAITMTTDAWPHGGTVADFNGDGLRDVAVAHRYSRSVLVFLNNGGFLFTTSSLPIAHSSTDVTSRDLNGDGHLDLAVSARGPSDDFPHWDFGLVYVYGGRGDGTFGIPTTFPAGIAAHSIVVGDFTRDGRTDVATLNGPNYFADNACGIATGLDSVSILPGSGDGTFGSPTTFALDTRLGVESLNTSDVNADGFPDLLAGASGKILIAAGPRANRGPVVNAGEDLRIQGGSNEAAPRGGAVDPDGHLLTFQWSTTGGFVQPANAPDPCFQQGAGPGPYTLTLTANDGHGGVASDDVNVTFEPAPSGPAIVVARPTGGEVVTLNVPYRLTWEASDPDGIQEIDVFFTSDGVNVQPVAECTNLPGNARECTWNRPAPLTEQGQILVEATDTTGLGGGNVSGIFAIRPAAGSGGLPAGWASTDVGLVAARGSASYDRGTFTIGGSGSDIWSTADEFHWTYTSVTGDFDVTTRVASVQNVNQWTKAGLMIRADNGDGSIHSSVFATPSTVKGTAFQRRRVEAGNSVHTSGPALTAPVWLRLSRRGTTVTAFARKLATDPWTRIGSESLVPSSVLVGLAVSSHVDGTIATARFDNVVIGAALPFTSADIGAVGVAGTTTANATGVTLEGSGADIWGTADAFRYYHARLTGDWTITARVRSLENTHAWAKAGVMFRESLAANSRQVMAIVSAGKGVALQYRGAAGGASAQAALRAGTAPEWLRLTREDSVFSAFVSDDGVTWTALGSVTVPMPVTIHVGLPVTSHNNGALATAQFTDVFVGQ